MLFPPTFTLTDRGKKIYDWPGLNRNNSYAGEYLAGQSRLAPRVFLRALKNQNFQILFDQDTRDPHENLPSFYYNMINQLAVLYLFIISGGVWELERS